MRRYPRVSAEFRPVILITIGAVATQSSALLSASLFGALGSSAVSGLRLLLAAVLLVAIFRPHLRDKSRVQWGNAIAYGVVIMVMNQCFFAALSRIPLGAAVTLEFLGPCAISFFGIKKWSVRLWALVALAGVVLIAGPSSGMDPVGIAFGLASAVLLGSYTLLAERVGKSSSGGLKDLSVSVVVAALISLPLSLPAFPHITASMWLLLLLAAFLGVMIPYSADTLAAKFSSAQVVGTLLAMDPVVGTILGTAVGSDTLTLRVVVGICLVTLAGAVMSWFRVS